MDISTGWPKSDIHTWIYPRDGLSLISTHGYIHGYPYPRQPCKQCCAYNTATIFRPTSLNFSGYLQRFKISHQHDVISFISYQTRISESAINARHRPCMQSVTVLIYAATCTQGEVRHLRCPCGIFMPHSPMPPHDRYTV